jgi:hypothetical protein
MSIEKEATDSNGRTLQILSMGSENDHMLSRE